MADNQFEIPQALRDMSEQNLNQARAAYEQFTDFVTKTMGSWMGALPSNPMAAVVKDMQGRAMQIAKENAESVFRFAGKISNALTPQDIVTLQTQFTQDRMQAFVTQMQQLFSVIEEFIQKSERGAMGASMGAPPSIPMVAGFEDVQDRAVAMVKRMPIRLRSGQKVAKAQNFQEIVTLQTRFAQDQIQAYATEMQELQRLMGNSPKASTRLILQQKPRPEGKARLNLVRFSMADEEQQRGNERES